MNGGFEEMTERIRLRERGVVSVQVSSSIPKDKMTMVVTSC